MSELQNVELRVRYLMPKPTVRQEAVFEFGGGEASQEIPERDIHALIDSMSRDPNNGAKQAEIFRFLVIEAKKRAETLAAEGNTDANKLWVSATDAPATPGQAMVGADEEGDSN